MIIELNREVIERLTKTELKIVQYINANETKLPHLSIVHIALDTFSSPSTVSRAIRKCGIQGFNELRYRSTAKANNDEIHNVGEIIYKSLIEAQRLLEQISIPSIVEIVNIIKKSKRVYVLSRGLTEYVAQEFVLKLQLLDINAWAITDPKIMKTRSKNLKKDEVVFIFSLNGKTPELIESARFACATKNAVIVCTCAENSELLELAQCSLVGFKHAHEGIAEYEVSSRVSLYMMSRIIIDYLATYGT